MPGRCLAVPQRLTFMLWLDQVENRQGLENFREILQTADGIILSRGNLGLDVAAEKMAMVQKVGFLPLPACAFQCTPRDKHELGLPHPQAWPACGAVPSQAAQS